ncbi:MAG: hypothetical protein OCD01_04805 [Fibrobacterales bacterium]
MSQQLNNNNYVESGEHIQQLKVQKIEKLEQVIPGISHDILNAVNVIEFNNSFLKDAYEEIFKNISVTCPETNTDEKIMLLSEKSHSIFKSIDECNGTIEKITHSLKQYLQNSEGTTGDVNAVVEQAVLLVKTSIEKSIDSLMVQLEMNCPGVTVNYQLLMQSVVDIMVYLGKDVGRKNDTLMITTEHRERLVTITMELVSNTKKSEGSGKDSNRSIILDGALKVPRQLLGNYAGKVEIGKNGSNSSTVVITLQTNN